MQASQEARPGGGQSEEQQLGAGVGKGCAEERSEGAQGRMWLELLTRRPKGR